VDRVIVTIERREWGDEHDLDLPADAKVADLLRELALAWGAKEEWAIYTSPAHRMLSPHLTLAQAGVGDGARLILLPAHVGVPAQSFTNTSSQTLPPTSLPNAAPVRRWRPLGAIAQPTTPPDPSPPAKGGFIWRRVDDEN